MRTEWLRCWRMASLRQTPTVPCITRRKCWHASRQEVGGQPDQRPEGCRVWEGGRSDRYLGRKRNEQRQASGCSGAMDGYLGEDAEWEMAVRREPLIAR